LATPRLSRSLVPCIAWPHDGGCGDGSILHPPGYPTYWVLASPLGNPAWRLYLFSALAAAGVAGLMALSIARVAELAGHSPRSWSF